MLDIAWVLAITPLTDRSATVFFVIAVYAVIGAAFRWGLKATVLTGTVVASLMVVLGLLVMQQLVGGLDMPGLGRLGLRAAYVVGLSYLIGALAEEQHQARHQAATVGARAGDGEPGRRPARQHAAAAGRAGQAFGATRAALAVKEVASGRAYLWDCLAHGEDLVSRARRGPPRDWWAPLPGSTAAGASVAPP